MPPRQRADQKADTAEDLTTARPASFKELCDECGPDRPMEPSTTSFSCDHVQAVFPAATDAGSAPVLVPVDPIEAARAALAGLDDDALAQLLTERQA